MLLLVLSTTNCLHNFNTVPSSQGRCGMRPTGNNFQVDRYGGALTVGNTQLFEQAPYGADLRNTTLLTVDFHLDHTVVSRQ